MIKSNSVPRTARTARHHDAPRRATTYPSTRGSSRELLAKKPDLAREQQQGRAIWWDKSPQDLALRREMDEGRVPQSPYVYQNE